ELSKLPNKYIHEPWEAPDGILEYAGIELGETYPKPIIEHKKGRERALAALNKLKG
ncbi:MAG: deoxyribodipyrimidine photo-lyase, partial [Puniceicoccaceae bacterium]